MAIVDDDAPRPPDPLEDLASAQARRALVLAAHWEDLSKDRGAEPQRSRPVSIYH